MDKQPQIIEPLLQIECFCSPPSSQDEILTCHVMMLGAGAFGRWIGHKGEPLVNRISALIRRNRQLESSLSALHHVRTQWKDGHQSASSPDTRSAGILSLDSPVSRTVRNKCLFKPSSLRYFVIVSQTDYDSHSALHPDLVYRKKFARQYPEF